MKIVPVALLLSALSLNSQQPQPGVTAPTPQEQAQAASNLEAETRAAAQPRGAEASQDELKVTPDEVKREVTDANKASNIIGMKVVNRQNEDLGEIKDLVVDLETGKVAYAVMSAGRGGFFGTNAKLVAVPISALTPRQGEDGFVIDADKERLEQAPGFAEKDWPAIDAAAQGTVGLTADPQAGERAKDASDTNSRNPALDPNKTERDR